MRSPDCLANGAGPRPHWPSCCVSASAAANGPIEVVKRVGADDLFSAGTAIRLVLVQVVRLAAGAAGSDPVWVFLLRCHVEIIPTDLAYATDPPRSNPITF